MLSFCFLYPRWECGERQLVPGAGRSRGRRGTRALLPAGGRGAQCNCRGGTARGAGVRGGQPARPPCLLDTQGAPSCRPLQRYCRLYFRLQGELMFYSLLQNPELKMKLQVWVFFHYIIRYERKSSVVKLV